MAAQSCITAGMSSLQVDMAGALAAAQAMGVEPSTAAVLLAACGRGLSAGQAERREKEKELEG